MKVKLSELAVFKLNHLLVYLDAEWGKSAKQRFLVQLEAAMLSIAKFPRAFPRSKFHDIHKCVVTRQTSLYYRILSDRIEVITVFDNRQDPEELDNEILRQFG